MGNRLPRASTIKEALRCRSSRVVPVTEIGIPSQRGPEDGTLSDNAETATSTTAADKACTDPKVSDATLASDDNTTGTGNVPSEDAAKGGNTETATELPKRSTDIKIVPLASEDAKVYSNTGTVTVPSKVSNSAVASDTEKNSSGKDEAALDGDKGKLSRIKSLATTGADTTLENDNNVPIKTSLQGNYELKSSTHGRDYHDSTSHSSSSEGKAEKVESTQNKNEGGFSVPSHFPEISSPPGVTNGFSERDYQLQFESSTPTAPEPRQEQSPDQVNTAMIGTSSSKTKIEEALDKDKEDKGDCNHEKDYEGEGDCDESDEREEEGESEEEDQSTLFSQESAKIIQECKNIFAKLKPRKNEKGTRQRVSKILDEWAVSGKLTDIEYRVDSIPNSILNISDLAKALKEIEVLLSDRNTLEETISLAYRVYCWVAKNISFSYEVQEVQDTDPLVILQRKKGLCRGYVSLFLALAQEVGLTVQKVNGHTRDLAPIPEFQPQNSIGHTWNVVLIEGVRFQVDCTYGSGNFNNGRFQREFSRVYFFPPPQRFILTHWVRDEHLQLLEHPVSLGEIKKMIAPSLETQSKGIRPNIFSPFIELGRNSFTVKIRVKCSDDIVISASLHDVEDDSKMKASNGNSLIHIQRVDNGELVTTVIPKKGKFILKISYAEKECFVEEGINFHCLSYVITSENNYSDSEIIGYPEILSEKSAVKIGFEIRGWTSDEPQNEWVCRTRGVINMKIKAISPSNLKHSICEGKDSHSHVRRLDCFTKLKSTEDSNIQNLAVIFPSRGWYTVFIDNSDNYMIMKYSVFATDGMAHTIYPYIYEEGYSLGISKVDSEEPVSYSESKPLSIKFHATSELEFSAELRPTEKNSANNSVDTKHHTFISQQADSGIYTLHATLPRGTWKLCLFANETCVMIVQPLYGPHVNPSCLYPEVYPEEIRKYGIILSESTYDRNCGSGFFQYAFNAPLDVSFLYELVKNSEPTMPMEDHHVVMNKPKGISLTENMINILFPSSGEWSLKVYAKVDPTRSKFDSVFELTIEAVVGQALNAILPRVTTQFTSMSLQPPTNIEQWMLPREVSEYPREIKIEFTQSSDDIELSCETKHDQRKYIDEDDDLARLTSADGEHNVIKRELIVTVKRKGEWEFTIYGRKLDDTSKKVLELLTYSVIGK